MIAHIDVEYIKGEPHYLIRIFESTEALARKEKCVDLWELEEVIPTEECMTAWVDKRILEHLIARAQR